MEEIEYESANESSGGGFNFGSIFGGAAILVSLGSLYYANQQSKDLQAKLEKMTKQTQTVYKSVDGINAQTHQINDITRRVNEMAKIIETQQLIINEQNERLSHLFAALIDTQKYLFRKNKDKNTSYKPYVIPAEMIILPKVMTNTSFRANPTVNYNQIKNSTRSNNLPVNQNYTNHNIAFNNQQANYNQNNTTRSNNLNSNYNQTNNARSNDQQNDVNKNIQYNNSKTDTNSQTNNSNHISLENNSDDKDDIINSINSLIS